MISSSITESVSEVDRAVVGDPVTAIELIIELGTPLTGHPMWSRHSELTMRHAMSGFRYSKPQNDPLLANAMRSLLKPVKTVRPWDRFLSEVIGTTVTCPPVTLRKMTFPRSNYSKVLLTCDVKNHQCADGRLLTDLITKASLDGLGERIARAARVEHVGAKLITCREKEMYPFKITPELEARTVQKLRQVITQGNYGELAPQHWNIINRMLDEAMRRDGEGVTHARLVGIMEMATVHIGGMF